MQLQAGKSLCDLVKAYGSLTCLVDTTHDVYCLARSASGRCASLSADAERSRRATSQAWEPCVVAISAVWTVYFEFLQRLM